MPQGTAELYAAAEGLAYMRGPDHPERHLVYHDRIEIPGAKWHAIAFEPTTDPELAAFTEAFDLMGDGSTVVAPTPGHLPGSVSMLVRRGERPPLLLIGDLTYNEDLLERDQVPAVGDKTALRASFAKVQALKQGIPDLLILPAHDASTEQEHDIGDSIVVHADPCPCASAFPSISVEGRDDATLRCRTAGGAPVEIAGLAIVGIVDRTPGVSRYGPRWRLRLIHGAGSSVPCGAKPDRHWRC